MMATTYTNFSYTQVWIQVTLEIYIFLIKFINKLFDINLYSIIVLCRSMCEV